MKRNRNALIWIGFAVLVAGLFSYPFLFGVPVLRDFPWVSVVAILVAVPLLWTGLARAWRERGSTPSGSPSVRFRPDR